MSASVEFLVRLLEQDGQPQVAQEDFEGEHSCLLHACQEAGFLSREPGFNAILSCPYCDDGVPYRLGERFVCHRCRSVVAPRYLWTWPLDVEAFVAWLASRLGLREQVRRVEPCLWQLGTWAEGGDLYECFFRTRGVLSERGETRLAAYRNALVLHGLSRPPEAEQLSIRCVLLPGLLRANGGLTVADLRDFLRPRGRVRFDAANGTLWAGDVRLGEIPPGCKEYFFLDCLARNLDRFVTYADLKREVLRRAGSSDTKEEATFCHGLKSRIKKKYVAEIDRLLVTTNKADGYRLRGHVEL